MKKINLFVLLTAVLLPLGLSAQQEKPNSNIGLSVEAGFSGLLLGPGLAAGYATPWFGGGGGGALYYELQYKHFLFRTGFGVDYTVNNNRLNVPDYTAPIVEYPGMTYHYTFNRYNEKTNYGVGYVPIMLGGNFDRLFFLAGAKIGLLSFGGSTVPRADVTIWATDEDVIDPMKGLYTHQLTDYTYTGSKTPLKFNGLNIMGSFEIGINLDCKLWKARSEVDKNLKGKKNAKMKPVDKGAYYKQLHKKKSFKDCLHYRISLFADYGFSNLLPSGLPTSELVKFNDVSDITPYSVYNYTPHQNVVLNNLLVGIKLAVQYEIPHRAPKKGDMANPYIVTFVRDERTDQLLAGAKVTTQAVTRPGEKSKKPVVGTTDSKYGRVAKAYPPGEYFISASHAGYIAIDSLPFTHRDAYDTLCLALYPQQTLRAQTIDAMSGRKIVAQISVYNEEGEIVSQRFVDSINNVSSCAVDDRKLYTVCAKAEGYKDTCIKVNNLKEIQTLSLNPHHVTRFVLKNMFFATNKTKILSSSEPALQELYNLLKDNPDIRIHIIGHTDDVGKDDYNQTLSEGRSASVKKEMVARGIDPKRISTSGRGEKDPIVPNDTDEHRQMNRRVEIVILD